MNKPMKAMFLAFASASVLAWYQQGTVAQAKVHKVDTTIITTKGNKKVPSKNVKVPTENYPVVPKPLTNKTGDPYATPTMGIKYFTSTITYDYGSGVTKQYKKVYQKAVNNWNYELNKNKIAVHFKYSESNPKVCLLQGTYFKNDTSTKDNKTTVGLTQTFYQHQYVENLVPARSSYVFLYTDSMKLAHMNTDAKQEVATHELGHVLGLGHNTMVPSDIMEPLFYHEVQYKVTSHDLASLKQLYGLKG